MAPTRTPQHRPSGVGAIRRWMLDRLAPGWDHQHDARQTLGKALRWASLLHRQHEHAMRPAPSCPLCELIEHALHTDQTTVVLR